MNSKYISIFFIIYLIKIVYNHLLIKPSESIISLDQFKSFIALCTGQRDTRVVNWRSPLGIDIEENNYQRVTVERKNSGLRLRIRNLTEDDQGIWTCSGFDQQENSISQRFHMNVRIPITFLSDSIQYAELDSPFIIKCRIHGNPSAEISWFKGQNKFEVISSNYEQKEDGLKISRVSPNDNDIFWCQADVIETGQSKEFPIQLIIAQSITSTRITCLTPCAVEKRTATLICEANGMPKPEYSWSYGQNSPFIVNGVSKYIVRGNRLIINYVDETDNGQYVCHAFNDYDKNGQKFAYTLKVIIPPVVLPISQIEISIDDDFSSRHVSFSCRVERGSTDDLSIQWFYPNNTLVQPINGISIDQSHRLSELIFNQVRREHHGNYTCLAKNSADIASTIARLFVHYKPVFIGPEKYEIYSIPDHPTIMKCEFDSSVLPILRWRKIFGEHNQIILDNNSPNVIGISNNQISSTIYETQLIFNPSQEDFHTKFECRADNSRIEKHIFILRQAQPPGQVRISRIEPKSNSVKLIIHPPSQTGGLPLIQYIITYQQINLPTSNKIEFYPVTPNGSEIIEIESLRAGTAYRFQVAVESEAGRSDFSVPVQVQTSSGNIPKFSLANDSCLTNKTCTIKWFIEDDGGSPISGGTIFYTEIHGKNEEGSLKKLIDIDEQTNEYELKQLKPDTNYLITVRLNNIAGYSEQNIRILTNKSSLTSSHRCSGHKCLSQLWIVILVICSVITSLVITMIIIICMRKQMSKQQNH